MFQEAYPRPELARELLSKHLPPRMIEVMNAVRVGPAAVIKALEKRAVVLQSLSRIEGGFGLAAVLLLYISQVTDALTFREMATAVRNARASELEVYAMTIEQELLMKGRQQGVEEGLATGLRTAILRALAVRFPGSAHDEAARLLALITDEGKLCALQDAALLADSFEEFLRSLASR